MLRLDYESYSGVTKLPLNVHSLNCTSSPASYKDLATRHLSAQVNRLMLELEVIQGICQRFQKPGYGSISAVEAMFLQKALVDIKADRVLEIGTAAGISTGLIGLFMNDYGGSELYSVDLHKNFFANKTKRTGYLAAEIHQKGLPKTEVILEKMTTDLGDMFADKLFDAVFIDANHQHPWPTLDMIACIPFLRKGGIMLHHDLALYTQQNPVLGIGPKFLYDQIPESSLTTITGDYKNIYYIRNDRQFEDNLIASLRIPWNLQEALTDESRKAFEFLIERYWSCKLLSAFQLACEKFR